MVGRRDINDIHTVSSFLFYKQSRIWSQLFRQCMKQWQRSIKLDSHISFLLSLTHSRHCYTTTTTKFVLKHEVLNESKNNPFLPPRSVSVSVLVSVPTNYRWIWKAHHSLWDRRASDLFVRRSLLRLQWGRWLDDRRPVGQCDLHLHQRHDKIVGFMNDVWGQSSCTFIEDLPFPVYECKREGYDWSYARYHPLGWYRVGNQNASWSEHTIWDLPVGCIMHPDPCNALQRVKEATNRVLDPDYNSRNSSSVCETCSDNCNDSCSYYCSDNDSSSATAISPRISASWVIMPAILAAIALAALS